MSIPLVDLTAQYESLRSEIDGAIRGVVSQTAFIGGDEVGRFEAEFAAYCETKAGVGVGNGTDALHLALRALGVGPGDEVITCAYTFIATAEAITMAGARPVFVDIREGTFLMDPDRLEAAITPRTKAVIPVHLYGHMCDMDRILAIARRRGLKVVEDAAQAHGARWRGRRAGSFGDAGCFSFFPSKNLGAYGDGGAVVSQDESLIRQVRMIANHGRLEKYLHGLPGVNSRLDGLQAAILRVKLGRLDAWNAARRRVAAEFEKAWKDLPVVLPAVHFEAEPVWHLYVLRVKERDRFVARLQERGIATAVHYPVPVPSQPAYSDLGIPAGAFPLSERAGAEVVSVPIYAELTPEQIREIVESVRAAAQGAR